MLRFLLILLFLPLFSLGQNLIPNGDFELGPDSSAEGWGLTVSGPDFWVPAIETPDRLYYGDPLNRDNDTAQSGVAYVEFYGKDTAFVLEAEAGKATLLSPLQTGEKYRLQFYLDIDEFFYNGAAGIAFQFNGGDTIASPLQANTGQWEYYDTTFVASGISTEIELLSIGGPSLVKVDNITLELDTNTGTDISKKTVPQLIIYPNPTTGIFTVQGTTGEIQVYDLFGRLVLTSTGPQVDMRGFSKGIYVWSIGPDSYRGARGKVVIE
jgi:hypothetical protein